MTCTIALALAELRAFSRDRVAAFNAVVVPLAAAAFLVVNPPPADELPGPIAGSAAAVVLAVFTSTALVAKAATTLVNRREQHLLERWHLSGTAPAAIIVGTLAPSVLLLVVGTAAMFPALAVALGQAPAHPAWLAVPLLLAAVLGTGAAVVCAGLARTTDAAGIVALPAMGAVLGGAIWTTVVPLDEVTWPMRATGGGALAEVVRLAWEGPTTGTGAAALAGAAAPGIVALLALTAIIGALILPTFRWQARG